MKNNCFPRKYNPPNELALFISTISNKYFKRFFFDRFLKFNYGKKNAICQWSCYT